MEEYRSVVHPVYEGQGYEVSESGKVKTIKSNKAKQTGEKQLLVPRRMVRSKSRGSRDNGPEYWQVGLSIGNKRNNVLIHRLVALAFVPNPKNYKYVNHKDGNIDNNHYTNLEWCTSKRNALHSVHTLGNDPKFLSNGGPSSRKVVEQLSLITGEVLNEFSSASKASEAMGVQRSAVGKVCRGVRPTAAGYGWRFKREKIV